MPPWIALAIALSVGCDRTAEIAEKSRTGSLDGNAQFVSTSAAPRAILDGCVTAYKKLSSYEDDGYVRLLYTMEGKPIEDRAPLAIGWNRQGHIGLQVYSLLAGPANERWRCRIKHDQALQDAQVISRAIPAKLDFSWLLDDAFVAENLSAGLAGFPPQLDLLIGDQPLAGLIDEVSQLAFKSVQSVDGRACHVIGVRNAETEVVLWIDQATMLLRRLHIPNSSLPPAMLADDRISEIQLTIELPNVRTNQAIDWARFVPKTGPQDRLVTHFVRPPANVNTEGLNRRIPAFRLFGPGGEVAIESSASNARGKILVLTWLANHPACRVTAEQLAGVANTLRSQNPEVAQDIELVSVWAEPSPPEGLSFDKLAEAWKLPGRLVVDREAMGRDLFGVVEAPTIIVLDAENHLQLRDERANPLLEQALPETLTRLVQGENLASKLLENSALEQQRYQAELQMALAIDGRERTLGGELPYAPATFRLQQLARDATTAACMATAVDARQLVWQLYADGRLEVQEILANPRRSFRTPWSSTDFASPRIQVSPESRYVALADQRSPQLHVFDTQTQQNRQVELDANCRILDFRWLKIGGIQTPRLAVVTSDGRTILLDPDNHEQLSGRCPGEPRAIVAHGSADSAIEGFVVLGNGRVEALQLSSDSTAARRGVGRAVAVSKPASSPEVRKQLSFQPALGPWDMWHDSNQQMILARGWLAQDEPALFLLNDAFQPLWHARMPVAASQDGWQLSAAAKDPTTGQVIWVVADPSRRIHLLRSDGLLNDHFRVEQALTGMALVPSGDRLILRLVHSNEIVDYQIAW